MGFSKLVELGLQVMGLVLGLFDAHRFIGIELDQPWTLAYYCAWSFEAFFKPLLATSKKLWSEPRRAYPSTLFLRKSLTASHVQGRNLGDTAAA